MDNQYHELHTNNNAIEIRNGSLKAMSETTQIYMKPNPRPDFTATVSISKFEAALQTYPYNGAHYELLHAGGDIFQYDCIGYKSYLLDRSQVN